MELFWFLAGMTMGGSIAAVVVAMLFNMEPKP